MGLDERLYELSSAVQETEWYQQPVTYVIAGLGILSALAIPVVYHYYIKKKENKNEEELRARITKRWMRRKDA